VQEAQVVLRSLFVACRDPAAALQPVKEDLDAITDAVELLVVSMDHAPRRVGRDYDEHALGLRLRSNRRRVVARVADQGLADGVLDQNLRDRRLVLLAGGQLEVKWSAFAVNERVDLGGESTT
jgi:hypothetical protein